MFRSSVQNVSINALSVSLAKTFLPSIIPAAIMRLLFDLKLFFQALVVSLMSVKSFDTSIALPVYRLSLSPRFQYKSSKRLNPLLSLLML